MNALTAAMEYKREFIKKYFADMETDIELQTELSVNVKLLQQLNNAFRASGLAAKEFISTIEWESINTEKGGALRSFQNAHGYQGIYLIDLPGNILYSGSEEHLGSNIFGNEYDGTKLGEACLATLKTGKSVLSDYGYHEASDKSLSLFLAKAVEDDETGEKIGVLVFDLPYTHLDTFMQSNFGLGESGETYLVGTDLLIRSNLRSFENSALLQTKIDTELINRWREEHEKWHELQARTPEASLPAPESIEEIVYANYQGVSVLGMYSSLDFLGQWGFHWVLVAEVNEEEAFSSATALKKIVITLLLSTSAAVLLLAWVIVVRLVSPLRHLTRWSRQVAAGDLAIIDIVAPANEIGQLNNSFRETVKSLRQAAQKNERYNWLRVGQLELDDQLRGDSSLTELAQKILTYLTKYLKAQIGALYINDEEILRLQASYAYRTRKNLASQFRIGEGMVGQAALERQPIIITHVPDDYIRISSGLGEEKPNNILLIPFTYNNTVKAVLEIGTFSSFTELQVSFLEGISEKLAVVINAAQSRNQLQKALMVTTKQANILQSQQEELKAANEELEEQTYRLRTSEEELQANQDQLVTTNEKLEEKNKSLNRQKQKIEQANKELERSRMEIEHKAEEVAR
ncbi:MAG: HAMP domain-containing protein, partial [Candidatus Electrothrix sp. AR4]|nr:HAMP domain-containing protein [Candidatus Electrothrix sp. AR4]